MAELENGWYISSTDDPNLEYVIDNGNGKYTFKPEAGGKTYEITYVEDGKTGTTIYTPNTEECNPCYKETTFNGWAGPNSFSPFPSAGGTAKVVYNLGECWEVKIVRNTKNATAVTTSQTSSTISVARNTTTGIVQSDVIYEFKNKYVPTATKQQIVSIFQQSKCSEDKICPVVTPTSATVSKTGGTVSVQFDADECWTLTKSLDKPGSVASFESDKKIKVEANASSEPRTITATYTFSNSHSDTYCDPQNVVITQEEGCDCTCSQIRRTNKDTSYNYDTTQQDNVLLKELLVDSNFACNDDIEVYTIDEGITDIWAIFNGTVVVEGVTYKELQIRGNLSEYHDGKRAIRFGIKVCNNDCTEINPFYVYQRCSCGMDNCRNEYSSNVFEDHPLYIYGGGNGSNCEQWWNGDAICVENLNLVKAVYFTRTFANNQDILNDVATESQKQTVYSGPVVNFRNGTDGQVANTLNTAYTQTQHEEREQLDNNKLLWLHNNMLAIYACYETITDIYPLGTSMNYVVDAPALENKEQVWEITYSTNSNEIIGGEENGRCALNTFVVTIYKAPLGWKYDGTIRDRNNKQKHMLCL